MHVVILLISLIVLVHSLGPDQPNGKYETEDGSACVWFELRKSERGCMFVTACHCKDGDGHRQSYSCDSVSTAVQWKNAVSINQSKRFLQSGRNSIKR